MDAEVLLADVVDDVDELDKAAFEACRVGAVELWLIALLFRKTVD